MGQSDDRMTLQLVLEVDNEGTNLTRSEIDFIATIIDNKQTTFSPEERKRVDQIHDRRVVNGKPERD